RRSTPCSRIRSSTGVTSSPGSSGLVASSWQPRRTAVEPVATRNERRVHDISGLLYDVLQGYHWDRFASMRTLVLGFALAACGSSDIHLAVDPACNPLGFGDHCAAPWPSSAFEIADAST